MLAEFVADCKMCGIQFAEFLLHTVYDSRTCIRTCTTSVSSYPTFKPSNKERPANSVEKDEEPK